MTHRLDAKALDAHRFSQARLDAMYAAIEIDDDIDPETPLPDMVTLDYDPSMLLDCYRLSRQLWMERVDPEAMIALTKTLRRTRDLDADERRAFKEMRAKIKNLRFACALFDARHRYPTILDWMTTALGHLQDAFKLGHAGATYREALLCRFFFAEGPQAVLQREIDRIQPAGTADFRFYVLRQIAKLRAILVRETVTGAQFHETRKIVSRQVAFYNPLRTIHPGDEAYKMCRALAAINGLMGATHDDLVARRAAGVQDYHRELFPLPDEIAARLRAVVSLYPESAS